MATTNYFHVHDSDITHQAHALGVDQPIAMDPPETHVLPSLDVDRLVDRGHVAEGGGLVQGRSSGRFQWTQSSEVVNLDRKISGGETLALHNAPLLELVCKIILSSMLTSLGRSG